MNENLKIPPKIDLAILAAILFACTLAPLFLDSYRLEFLRDLLCLSIFATSVNLLWAQGGLLSFGHATFFGLGAYGIAIVSGNTEWASGAWLGMLAGILCAATLSGIIGYFLLFGGVRGAYFTIVTLALGIIFEQVILAFPSITGGNTGLIGSMELALPGGTQLQEKALYFTILAATAMISGLLYKINTSRHGLLLKAILDNEQRASALGNNTPVYLLWVFIGSAIFAAFAGALYASGAGFIAPDTIGLSFSTQVVIWVAIGARGTLSGPIIGAFLIVWLENTLSSLSTHLWPLILGAIFVAAVFLLPYGIMGWVLSMRNKLMKTAYF